VKKGNIFWWVIKILYKITPFLVVGSFVIEILISLLPIWRNFVFSKLIDAVTKSSGSWPRELISFTLLSIVSGIIFYFQRQFGRISELQINSKLRQNFLKKISSLDYQLIEDRDVANQISKVDENFTWRTRQTFSDILSLFSNFIGIVAIVLILVGNRYWYLSVLLVLSQLPAFFIQRYWAKIDWDFFNSNAEKNRKSWDFNWQLTNKNFLNELKINKAVNFLYQKYVEISDFFANGRIKIRQNQNSSQFFLIMLSNAVIAFCLLVLIKDVVAGLVTIGMFTFYFQTIRQTNDLFSGVVYSLVSLSEQKFHLNSFKELMNLDNIIVSGSKEIKSIVPLIEFKGVSFKYPESNRFVFKNLNLVIPAGKDVALVGPNGAGKSTFIKLLCRFYDPQEGEILIDGINLKDINLDQWYKKIAYLSQEFNSFYNLSLKENVFISQPDKPTDEKVKMALNKADALNFSKKYDKGLETILSRRYGGEEPSWGQWQKIAIARIFYKDSNLMIMDEPTASIDAVSEYKIFNKIYRETKNKTVIIVSHRFSTVRNADVIVVIDKGKIVEQGSHEELIKKDGLYAKSYALQAKGYV
jgi:ATP-binding cassette subfamily B protein